jgi:hypothetical protein
MADQTPGQVSYKSPSCRLFEAASTDAAVASDGERLAMAAGSQTD